jgi:hypothetical protein
MYFKQFYPRINKLEEIMKELKAKQILDKALELEDGSELYVTCKTSEGKKFLYLDLMRQRRQAENYESIVILQYDNNIILTKQNYTSIYIRKLNSSRENVSFTK